MSLNISIKQTFHKQERLCSKKQIDFLFRVGQSSMFHPVKIIFSESVVEQKFPVKAMFVVPKKNFRKAHDRNKLKRRMKEVYRLHKKNLYASMQLKSKKLLVSFIFIGKKTANYKELETSIKNLMVKVESFNFKPN